jgi:hypothetical protein
MPHPPIFVLGAPRSGSTLLTQVITDVLNVGYLSNRHCTWFGAPAWAERLFRPLVDKPTSDYRSAHGTTKGPHAPSECGEWWYRFFPRIPAYVTLDELSPARMDAFRSSVAALTRAHDRPVIFKNLYASLRVQAIARQLPESLFLIIYRDEVDNGHSLLEARLKRFGDYAKWFSVAPPETEKLKRHPPHEQVIEQIRCIHATIDRDLRMSNVSPSRCLHFHYEEFCANPSASIDSLQAFLESHGCQLERRRPVPTQFERRSAIRIDSAIYKSMLDYSSST